MTTTSNPFATAEQRWQALAGRDRSAIDAFIYGVKSTGVYCHPLCGSRLPRRDNAEFFDSAAAAEAKGFRACKRCKPDQPLIRYTLVRSTLGLVLIAENKEGVAMIEFGKSRSALLERLKQEFPLSKLLAADEEMKAVSSAVLSVIDGKATGSPLSFDVSGTPFHHRVWSALAKIPRGETRTYRQIAAAIGKPSATRAVAQACAANRLAVVVPCHRVIRQDGSLSGYRWGAERKRALLAREGVAL